MERGEDQRGERRNERGEVKGEKREDRGKRREEVKVIVDFLVSFLDFYENNSQCHGLGRHFGAPGATKSTFPKMAPKRTPNRERCV